MGKLRWQRTWCLSKVTGQVSSETRASSLPHQFLPCVTTFNQKPTPHCFHMSLGTANQTATILNHCLTRVSPSSLMSTSTTFWSYIWPLFMPLTLRKRYIQFLPKFNPPPPTYSHSLPVGPASPQTPVLASPPCLPIERAASSAHWLVSTPWLWRELHSQSRFLLSQLMLPYDLISILNSLLELLSKWSYGFLFVQFNAFLLLCILILQQHMKPITTISFKKPPFPSATTSSFSPTSFRDPSSHENQNQSMRWSNKNWFDLWFFNFMIVWNCHNSGIIYSIQ